MVISGAGPTLLALTTADRAQTVADAMGETWSKFKVDATTRVLAIETQGAIATTLD
jgi:homoserine kinase